MDLSPLVGNWVNTETRSEWIARIEVRDDNGRLFVHPIGKADWEERPATAVYAAGITSTEGAAWIADFSQSRVEALLNSGLLVLVAHDGRRFTREFFRRSS
jgi:hypothetical protein